MCYYFFRWLALSDALLRLQIEVVKMALGCTSARKAEDKKNSGRMDNTRSKQDRYAKSMAGNEEIKCENLTDGISSRGRGAINRF